MPRREKSCVQVTEGVVISTMDRGKVLDGNHFLGIRVFLPPAIYGKSPVIIFKILQILHILLKKYVPCVYSNIWNIS